MQHLQAAFWQTRSQIAGTLRHHHRKQLQAHAASGGCSSSVHSCIQQRAVIQLHVSEAVHRCLYHVHTLVRTYLTCIQQQWGFASSGLVKCQCSSCTTCTAVTCIIMKVIPKRSGQHSQSKGDVSQMIMNCRLTRSSGVSCKAAQGGQGGWARSQVAPELPPPQPGGPSP